MAEYCEIETDEDTVEDIGMYGNFDILWTIFHAFLKIVITQHTTHKHTADQERHSYNKHREICSPSCRGVSDADWGFAIQ